MSSSKKFYKKYRHVGISYPAVPPGWVPKVKQAIIDIEREMWPVWMPMFIKRFIHYRATGGSIVRVKSRFWYRVRDRFAKGMITDIKDKYATPRIYLYGTDKMFSIVDKLEEDCLHICEECGYEGPEVTVNNEGWMYCLCDKCRLKPTY